MNDPQISADQRRFGATINGDHTARLVAEARKIVLHICASQVNALVALQFSGLPSEMTRRLDLLDMHLTTVREEAAELEQFIIRESEGWPKIS